MDQFEAAVDAFDQADYKTAFYLFFPLAMEGNERAQSYIDRLQKSNQGIPKDYERVRPWQDVIDLDEGSMDSLDSFFGALDYETYLFFEGVDEKDADASNQLEFAIYLFEFDNGEADDNFLESRKYMELAAEGGNAISQWNMAEGGGLKEALKWYAVLAESGDLTAKYKLACRHLYWVGDDQSVALGMALCREAALAGSIEAQVELADLYFNGKFCSQNYAEAEKFLKLAILKRVERNDTLRMRAYGKLGRIYEKGGFGIDADPFRAATYVRDSGYPGAAWKIRNIYLAGPSEGGPDKHEWCRFFSTLNVADAYFDLGYLYLGSQSNAENLLQAVWNFDAAARLGHPDAKTVRALTAANLSASQARQLKEMLQLNPDNPLPF